MWMTSLPVARCFTKSAIPPVALKTCFTAGVSRSSTSWISMPFVRKACSCMRSASIDRFHSVPSVKISGSGQNVTRVPVFVLALPFMSLEVALPRA